MGTHRKGRNLMQQKNILIVGAGGIGSWLAFNLFKLQEAGQLKQVRSITLADPDTVEMKNIFRVFTGLSLCTFMVFSFVDKSLTQLFL